MSSETSFVLIRRLADGTVEWIPLEVSPQRVPVVPNAAYTLVDRANYEAPQTLEVQRVGENLVVEVEGTEVLALDGFFTNVDVTFYPTTNVAGGAGPFSGTPLTADSAVFASAAAAAQVVSTGSDDRNDEAGATGAGGTAAGGGSSPLLWVGVAAGGLGLAAAAGGGGGGSSGGGSGPPVVDTVPPQITSGTTAVGIAENSGAGQVVYTATATDAGAVTYSLKAVGDAAAFSINANNGAVALTGNPDYEAKSSYNFTVVATDAASNSSERAVSLAINNVNDTGDLVTITSGATAAPIDENSGPARVVYTVAATATGALTYSLEPGGDAGAFTINPTTGAVTLIANPNDETKGSYSFTVRATDAAGNFDEQAVSLQINDLDEVAPIITSGATATAINENVGPGRVVYTVTSTDTDVVSGTTTYSKAGVDAAFVNVNPTTGVVTLIGNPDFETKASYSFTVRATDGGGNFDEQAVSLAINDIADETPPEVDDVEITGAVGAQNGILNAGDTVSVRVTMDEDTLVNTAGGTPSIALSIGGNRVAAGYVSGSGTSNLIFRYVIQPGDTDNNGVSIQSGTLALNGGTMADAAGNAADLDHGSDGSNFDVDTTAPILSSSDPDDNDPDFPRGDDIVLDFSEAIQAGTGNITISSTLDTRTIDVNDASQVSINGDEVTIDPTFDLFPSTDYSIRIDGGALTDDAGNAYAGINNNTTLNFTTREFMLRLGLTQGPSSDSSRTFQSDASEGIDIRVAAADATPSNTTWSGSGNLGSDDRASLVGDDAASTLAWQASDDASLDGSDVADSTLFDTSTATAFVDDAGGQTHIVPFADMPAVMLTSQGLA